MSYNTTAMENSSTIVSFFDAIFQLTDSAGNPIYITGYCVLFLVFLAIFIPMKRNSDFIVGLLSSSFICSMISALMYYQNYISITGVIIPIFLLISSLLYIIFTKEGNI